jgi:fibronectin-binding autotransporter adhesin
MSPSNVSAASIAVGDSVANTGGATGTITFGGMTDTNAAEGINLNSKNIRIKNDMTAAYTGGVADGGKIQVRHTSGYLQIDPGATIYTDGGFYDYGDGDFYLYESIKTSGDAVQFNSPVILSANDLVIDTTNGGGVAAGNSITFGKTLTDNTLVNGNLDLNAGTGGNVVFTGQVGANDSTRLGALKIVNANNVTANAAVYAGSLTQIAGKGTTTLNGAVNTSGAVGVSLMGTNLAVNAGVTTTGGGTVTVSESGTTTFAAAGDINSDGAVSITVQAISPSTAP